MQNCLKSKETEETQLNTVQNPEWDPVTEKRTLGGNLRRFSVLLTSVPCSAVIGLQLCRLTPWKAGQRVDMRSLYYACNFSMKSDILSK